MALKRWRVKQTDSKAIRELCAKLNISSLAARTLAARGFADERSAKEFLSSDAPIGDPLALADMQKAAQRINEAIESEQRIAVFGDYDVDGITSTAVMMQYLEGRGADVVCSLPTRESTGYGLSPNAVDNLSKVGVSLIVTVDNGISAHEEIAYAASLGIDTVVCDHHLPAPTLPAAYAVVDPLREDDKSEFKELAGVGVALKLCAACEDCGADELLEQFGYLVAIGTIADIMPLIGENRTIVRRGLEQLPYCDNPGILALCESAGVDIESVDAASVAFTLSPRLNAAGRMGSADAALRLLLCEDVEQAQELARTLDELNRGRQDAESEAAKLIHGRLTDSPELLRGPIIIVEGEKLHSGVIGIVCSRLVERTGKPVIVISVEDGQAKGSGRGVAGFSLHDAIASCADILIKFGGHEMAAGFMLEPDKIPEFRSRIYDYCARDDVSVGMPELSVDSFIELEEINEDAVSQLTALAPFGRRFEEPVFAAKDLVFVSAAKLGERHSKLTFRKNGRTLSGAMFSVLPSELPFVEGEKYSAAFILSIYDNSQRRFVSVKFKDVLPACADARTFDSFSAYRALCANKNMSNQALEPIALARADIAAVYRALREGSFDMYNEPALMNVLPALPVGKALCALEVLMQLGLAALCSDGRTVQVVKDAPKRDLSESELFRRLCGEKK